MELLTGAPYHVTTPVMAMIFVLYGLTCCLLSPEVQVRVTKFSIIVLGISMAAVVIGAGAYVLIDMIKCEFLQTAHRALQSRQKHVTVMATRFIPRKNCK